MTDYVTGYPVSLPPGAVSPGQGLAIRTRSLVHVYHADGHDVAALSGVDLVVGAGEMMGLLGPSGAGKSTLLGLLGGLFPPTAGKVLVGDLELSAATTKELDRYHASRVSLMLQGASRNLLPYYGPAQNIAFAQRAARRAGVRDLPSPVELLSLVALPGQAHVPLDALSAGELQLVALAVAVAVRPGLLLADEPTSQLDHRARDLVLETIGRINRELGTTVVVVTHDPDVARWLPRTVTIRDGRIGGEGRAGEEYAVVTADGFLPLPAHVLASLPPGTLVRLHEEDGSWSVHVEHGP